MRAVVLSVVLVMLASGAWAEDYQMERHVFGTAGGLDSTDQYVLGFTAGEPVVACMESDSLIVTLGYWRQGSACAAVDTDYEVGGGATFGLAQNSPNPFGHTTLIRYAIGQGQALPVAITIYDVRGAVVRTLVSQVLQPGVHHVTWDGNSDSGQPVGPGVYYCKMQAGTFVDRTKLVVLK